MRRLGFAFVTVSAMSGAARADSTQSLFAPVPLAASQELLIVASNTCAAGGQFSITVTNLKTGVVIKTFQPPSDSPKTVSTVVRSASTLDAVGVVASLNCPGSGDSHRGLMSISLRDRVSKVASFIGSPVDGQGI